MKQKRGYRMNCNPLNLLVGETGIEPATPCSQGRCATRLRYSPTKDALYSMVAVATQENKLPPLTIYRPTETSNNYEEV